MSIDHKKLKVVFGCVMYFVFVNVDDIQNQWGNLTSINHTVKNFTELRTIINQLLIASLYYYLSTSIINSPIHVYSAHIILRMVLGLWRFKIPWSSQIVLK